MVQCIANRLLPTYSGQGGVVGRQGRADQGMAEGRVGRSRADNRAGRSVTERGRPGRGGAGEGGQGAICPLRGLVLATAVWSIRVGRRLLGPFWDTGFAKDQAKMGKYKSYVRNRY